MGFESFDVVPLLTVVETGQPGKQSGKYQISSLLLKFFGHFGHEACIKRIYLQGFWQVTQAKIVR